MNNYILELIKSVGHDYQNLITKGLIPSTKPAIDRESAFYSLKPEPGLELAFSTYNNALERVLIIKESFNGKLPEPLDSLKNKEDTLARFGEPTKSTGYKKLPIGLGEIGGTDMYYLPQTNRNAKITFSYNTTMEIIAIAFNLIHDSGKS